MKSWSFPSLHPFRFPINTLLSFFPSNSLQGWERLEKAEHERELALRNELIRQEKLEQLTARFDRKAAMRETWLSENQRLVSQVSPEWKDLPGPLAGGNLTWILPETLNSTLHQGGLIPNG